MVRTLLERNNCRLAEVTAIGLGIPVPITREGRIGAPALAPRWADVDAAEALTKRLDNVPVLVDNNANLGALGEYTFGGLHRDRPAGRSYEMIYVKLAAGIGAGILRDGQLHRGASGTAGELGHITLDPKDPTKCLCGNQSCLELYAGEEVLLKKARIAWPDLSDTLELVDRAKAGDHYCISVIQDAGDYAGLALGILVNLTGPDLILIGGELSDADDIPLGPIRQKIDRTAMPKAARTATISTAPLRKWSSAWVCSRSRPHHHRRRNRRTWLTRKLPWRASSSIRRGAAASAPNRINPSASICPREMAASAGGDRNLPGISAGSVVQRALPSIMLANAR